MAIPKKVLDILVCPKCKGELIYDIENSMLVCKNCMLGYPVKDDIPIMLIDETINLESEDVG